MTWHLSFPYFFGFAFGTLNGWLQWGRRLQRIRKIVRQGDAALAALAANRKATS